MIERAKQGPLSRDDIRRQMTHGFEADGHETQSQHLFYITKALCEKDIETYGLAECLPRNEHAKLIFDTRLIS